ncbi:MAG: CoA pyrophosphatase [Legionella longbeachae]|nr:CoA pyrophosphatase [Legionella longbeachae]
MALNELKKKSIVNSAVVVLYEQLSDSLILTRRCKHLRSHPGEICFPGGMWEEGDDNLYATALRELNEELGISADRLTLIKELKIEKTLLGNIIYPWFVHIESVNPYQLNIAEVERVISIPMPLVQDPQNYRDLQVERDGRSFIICEFTGNKDGVWGATARIMKQLIK